MEKSKHAVKVIACADLTKVNFKKTLNFPLVLWKKNALAPTTDFLKGLMECSKHKNVASLTSYFTSLFVFPYL